MTRQLKKSIFLPEPLQGILQTSKSTLMKKSLIILFSFLFCFHSFSQQIDLSYKLEKGLDYKLSFTTILSIYQEVNGQLMKIDKKLESIVNFSIEDIRNEEYMIEVKYDNLEIENTVRDQAMKFSSDSDNENDLISKVLSEMTEKSISCSMDKYGKMVCSSGFDNILSDILDSIPGISPDDRSQLEQQLKNAFGSEAFKKSIETALHIYPVGPVRLNERWWIESTVGAETISANMEFDYILFEETDEYYKIVGNAWAKTNKDSTFSFFGMEAWSDLEAECNKDIKVNKENGWIKKAETKYTFEGKIMIKPNPKLPEGLEIPYRMNATVVIW